MALTPSFNDSSYSAKKSGAGTLSIRINNEAGTNYLTYDFNARIMLARTGSSEGGLVIFPFSQLDRESLEAARDQLKTLGGNPPEIPVYNRHVGQIPPAPGGFNT